MDLFSDGLLVNTGTSLLVENILQIMPMLALILLKLSSTPLALKDNWVKKENLMTVPLLNALKLTPFKLVPNRPMLLLEPPLTMDCSSLISQPQLLETSSFKSMPLLNISKSTESHMPLLTCTSTTVNSLVQSPLENLLTNTMAGATTPKKETTTSWLPTKKMMMLSLEPCQSQSMIVPLELEDSTALILSCLATAPGKMKTSSSHILLELKVFLETLDPEDIATLMLMIPTMEIPGHSASPQDPTKTTNMQLLLREMVSLNMIMNMTLVMIASIQLATKNSATLKHGNLVLLPSTLLNKEDGISDCSALTHHLDKPLVATLL